MPFGLMNVPGTFQRVMDVSTFSIRLQHVVISVDDIVVFLKTSTEHNGYVQSMLVLLEDAGIALKRKGV